MLTNMEGRSSGPPLFAEAGRSDSIKDHFSSAESLPNRSRGRANRVLVVSLQGMFNFLLSGCQMTNYTCLSETTQFSVKLLFSMTM